MLSMLVSGRVMTPVPSNHQIEYIAGTHHSSEPFISARRRWHVPGPHPHLQKRAWVHMRHWGCMNPLTIKT